MKILKLEKLDELFLCEVEQEDSNGKIVNVIINERSRIKTEEELKKELKRIKRDVLSAKTKKPKEKKEKIKLDKKETDRIQAEINL